MSNFLLACGKKPVIERITKWLSGSEEVSPEISILSLDNGYDVISVSKSSHLEQHHDQIIFMQGWILDHGSKSIVLGQNGFNQMVQNQDKAIDFFDKASDGTYVLGSFTEQQIKIKNDIFCLHPVMYFNEQNIFVCSDSLFMISELRKSLNIPCTINKNVVYSRSWNHGLACAVMGNETIVKNVKILSPGKEISIEFESKKPGDISLQKRRIINEVDIKKLFFWNEEDYVISLRQVATEFVQSITSIAKIPKLQLNFGLSGGLDSRAILAVLLSNHEILTNTRITTNEHPSREEDYIIVEKLSEKFGFEFNQNLKTKTHLEKHNLRLRKIEDPFSLWILSSLGIFDMMYLHNSYWNRPHFVEIGGHGAEIIKGTFAHTKLTDLIYKNSYISFSRNLFTNFVKNKHARRKLNRINKEINNALSSSGINTNELGVFQWHHMCYKSPIQNGRFLDRTMLGFRPYIQKNLCSFALSKTNYFRFSKQSAQNIIHDLLIILNPDLAAEEFENQKYNVNKKYIEERLVELGGKFEFDKVSHYSIYGDLEEILNGPPDVFLEKSNGVLEYSEDMKSSILKNMESIWGNVSRKNKLIYKDAYKLAISRLTAETPYIPNAGSPAAKIISLILLDEK